MKTRTNLSLSRLRLAALLLTVLVSLPALSQRASADLLALNMPVSDTEKPRAPAAPAAAAVPAFEFLAAQEAPTAEQVAETTANHKLGRRVAAMQEQMRAVYVTKEEVVPGDPARRTVIRKPDIYNAVAAVERGIVRGVKAGDLNAEAAEAEFMHVLAVALAAADTESADFENALRTARKQPDVLRELFRRAQLKSIY